ncbi:MAG: primosomal protein N' [Phycisphaerae bacterium]|nr:primosomal protein N' [Phycisphaerae bacterium]
MSRLFEEPQDSETIAAPVAVGGRVVGVAVNAPLWADYDYVWPAGLGEPVIGQRVRVPFGRGNRKSLGFVVDTSRAHKDRPLKAVAELVDKASPLDEGLWALGQWISRYYLSPVGMTLAAMVPAAVGAGGQKNQTVVYLAKERGDWPSSLGLRQRKILDELLEARKQGVEPVSLESLRHHSGAGRDTIRRLLQRELIRTEVRPVMLENLCEEAAEGDTFELNDDQKAVLAALEPKLAAGGFSVSLLEGVTGSGKTEVYVRAIRRVIEAGKQAILLTPEIALTTQTLQRLLKRLPRVAVLHSGLTNSQRAFYWDQIRSGHASVVVGPRSAIFAPAANLGLIIVDEEHESSYKQDTAPRYHGRDVAVKRAALAKVPIILGSATPAMESINNARQGRYDLLRLPKRVRSLPMPTLQIVNLRSEMQKGKIELLGRTLVNKMAGAIDRQEQIILLMNRRGYASYVFCPSCQWMMQCDDCLRPMVWHQAIGLLTCHHCNKTAQLPQWCPACDKKIILFGYGIQRIEDELTRKFPLARVARMDSDTMTSPKQFQKVLGQFSDGEIDILLGTQMVAKGLDFPRVSLVGVVSADTSLAINDFRASERTFQLIVQVAGRAGRGDTSGEVVVQTLHADDPAIQFAREHDYEGFSAYELADRQDAHLPPFARMVRFVIRHEKIAAASAAADKLAGMLRKYLPADKVTFIGPQQAEFVKIRKQFRFHILLITSNAGVIQNILHPKMREITKDIPAEVLADVDPMNLM